MIRFISTLVAAFFVVLVVSSTSAASSSVISVVYFVPRDQTPSEYPVDAIMADVQGWYGVQVGSTFNTSPVQVIQGQKTAAQYQDNIWGDVLRELGYYCGTGVHVIFVHPSIGFTGGGACGEGDGTAMIKEGEQGGHTGIVAHELGHAFALPHSTCESVMWCWWDYPDVGLLGVEVDALRASQWFWLSVEPEPTPTVEPTPTPEPTPKPCEPKFNPHGKLVGAKRCR